MSAVESNIVGYQNQNSGIAPDGYKLIGFQFDKVGGEGTLKITDVKPLDGCTGPSYMDWDVLGLGDAEAPQIMVRDADGNYSNWAYYLCDGIDDGPGWVDVGMNPVDFDINLGDGAWLCDNFNAKPNWSFAGEVHGNDVDVDFANDYTLSANPFPVAASLTGGKIDWSNLVGPSYMDWDILGLGTEEAPQVMVRDADGNYSNWAYYLCDGIDDGPGWVDVGMNPIEFTIPAGAGFWFYNPSTSVQSVKFSR